jgi:hypothetical protein
MVAFLVATLVQREKKKKKTLHTRWMVCEQETIYK